MNRILATWIVVVACLAGGFCSHANAALSYSGSVSGNPGSTIVGGGNWLLGTSPISLSWTVSDLDMDGTWHYDYTFTHARGETSHLLLEVSQTFTLDNIFNVVGGTAVAPTTYAPSDPGNSNPSLPGSIFAIKFDGTTGNTTTISFDSDRAPVWGDFYSKDGNAGGLGTNVAWNSGFTAADPTDAPANGSLNGHILVPDSVSTVVPEASSLVAWGLCALVGGVFAYRRRRIAK